ncbi:PAS domain-containing protein, partial [Oceanospirillum sp. HFRX-1_2]
DCFSKKTLAGEKAFELHTDYITKLLQDAGNLLLTADKHSDILTDPFIPKSTQLIVDISFYAETAGQLRGRLSAYLSKENQLTSEPLQEVKKELEKRSLGFKELANDEIVQEMGLASYTARNHRHYLQLREYIAQITAGKASASGSKFFETATRFIEDLHFMREQLNQNLANRINRNIDLQNNQLVKIGVAAFVLFLVLIGLLLARFHAEHQKTKLRNLELSFLKKALDNHAIVSMTDAQGNITFVNEKFCAISGFESDELIGRNHRIINSGVHSSAFVKKLWDSVHNNNSWSGEVCNRKKTGELYWVFATVLPLFDDKNKLISIISVRTDITQQKQSEALLQKEKAEAANQAKSDFLAN